VSARSDRRRQRLRFAVAACIAAALPFAACGFPDVTFTTESGEAGAGEAGNEAASGEAGAVDGGADGDLMLDAAIFDALIDGRDPDAAITKDAGGVIDAAGCAANDCDCDNDTYNDLTKSGCAGAGGPSDCDDTRDGVHPNKDYSAAPNPPRGGDVNCVDGVEKFYPTKVSCGLLALGACAGVQGFSGDPACGESGPYVFCAVQNAVLCVTGSTTSRTQACR
jgi:hypothetical protein